MAGVPRSRVWVTLGNSLLQFIPAIVILIIFKFIDMNYLFMIVVSLLLMSGYYGYGISRDSQLRSLFRRVWRTKWLWPHIS